MRTVALRDVATTGSGGTPKRSEPSYFGDGTPWLSIADLNDGVVTTAKESLTEAGIANSSAKIVPAGTLLIAMYGSIGKLGIAGRELCTSQAIAFVRPDPNHVDLRYLFHYLLAERPRLLALGRGGTQMNIGLGDLKEWLLPLPSLVEQRRIAAILDQADTLRVKRSQVVANLDTLAQSVFHDMFGDPITNNMSLPRVPIGSVTDVMTGNSPSRAVLSNFGNSIEWIKSDNLGGRIATHAAERLSESGQERSRVAPAGSVLVTCIAGSPRSIGKSSLVDRAVAFNQQINAVLPSDNLDALFILGQLKTSPDLVRNKSTGGMKGLVSKSAFQTIEILLPPIEEQRAYAARVVQIDGLHAVAKCAADSCERLFSSLQSSAFRGEL